jgi:hypothetical protein
VQKRLVWVCKGRLCPRKRPDVSRPILEEAGRYRMVSELTLMVSRVHVSQLYRHDAHGWCGPRVITQHGTCAGTRHMNVAKRM